MLCIKVDHLLWNYVPSLGQQGYVLEKVREPELRVVSGLFPYLTDWSVWLCFKSYNWFLFSFQIQEKEKSIGQLREELGGVLEKNKNLMEEVYASFGCTLLIGHLHDDVIWRQLPECISLNLCYADLCHARAILHKRKKYGKYNSLPQSILVVVVKWRHHANVVHASQERQKVTNNSVVLDFRNILFAECFSW